jgi:hypothetical protein
MAVRIALRDSYGKPNSNLGKTVAKLTEDLGMDATLHLDWNAAWEKLKGPFKDDPQTFVPRLADAANDLVTTVQGTIDEHEAWGYKLLSEIARAGKGQLDLYLVVSYSQPFHCHIDAVLRSTAMSQHRSLSGTPSMQVSPCAYQLAQPQLIPTTHSEGLWGL